jgi:hypothetical protein
VSCVLGAFALIALALDEPAAPDVEAILRRGGSRISSINLAESVDQLGRVHGHTIADLQTTLAPVLGGLSPLFRRTRRLRGEPPTFGGDTTGAVRARLRWQIALPSPPSDLANDSLRPTRISLASHGAKESTCSRCRTPRDDALSSDRPKDPRR